VSRRMRLEATPVVLPEHICCAGFHSSETVSRLALGGYYKTGRRLL
jgi:hypothetical protein